MAFFHDSFKDLTSQEKKQTTLHQRHEDLTTLLQTNKSLIKLTQHIYLLQTISPLTRVQFALKQPVRV